MSVADFEATRNEALTQRMRSARAEGKIPMWQRQEEEEVPAPPEPVAEPPATPGPDASQLSLVVCVLAAAAGVALLVQMVGHRAQYNY